jgi:hypothetical protein
MQAKRPSRPYAPKADGSSYCRLVGGPWDKLWVRCYPTPPFQRFKGVQHATRYMPPVPDYEFDEELVLAGDKYQRQAIPEVGSSWDVWRQVEYQWISRED